MKCSNIQRVPAYAAQIDHVIGIIEKPLYAMMKLSVLYFFRRLFLIRTSFRVASKVLVVFTILWAVAFTLGEIAICGGKLSILWDPSSQSGSCANHRLLDISFAVTDLAGDIAVIILPYPYIRELRITSREKVAITSIFLLGTLSTAASAARLVSIAQAFEAVTTEQATHSTGTGPAVWSFIEAGVGVLAACLPPLGPLLRRIPSLHKAPGYVVSRVRTRRGSNAKELEGHALQDTRLKKPEKASHDMDCLVLQETGSKETVAEECERPSSIV